MNGSVNERENGFAENFWAGVAKKLVELLKGRIEVTSTPGKGSTFTLYLDFARVGNYQKKAERSAPVAGNLPGKRILVCEDNAINAEIVTKLLEHQKMQVVHAKNGKEGLEVFQASEPGYFNAILMDVRMPVLDGIAASKSIRRLSRQDAEMVPIIALSANAYQEDIEKALAAGINDYIVKPVVPGLLYHVLSSWIKQ